MSDKAKPEFSLDQFSEAETDEEFGLPEFKEHFADTLTPAVLRDWTAKDFASIYVRFRPHLERHAKRFLVNPSQVEEVVQDAFLYLMTSLPELDSELGVLKFLKWKVRMLSLDVIRLDGRAEFTELEDGFGMTSVDANLGQDLEQAEDAAVVALALSKLQPRHREALIATLYEEKSSREVALQMGLSENALRQLLFRARAAFKKSLIGEADVSGRSMSEILSLAARKAVKSPTTAAGLLVTLAVTLGIVPFLSNVTTESPIAAQTLVSPVDEGRFFGQTSPIQDLPNPVATQNRRSDEDRGPLLTQPQAQAPNTAGDNNIVSTAVNQDSSEETESIGSVATDASQVEAAAFDWASEFLNEVTSKPGLTVLSATNSRIDLSLGTSSTITLLLTPNENQLVSSVVVSANGSLRGLIAVPTAVYQESYHSAAGATTLRLIMTGFAVGDLSGTFGSAVLEDAHFSEIAVAVNLNFEDESLEHLSSATSEFLPRT